MSPCYPGCTSNLSIAFAPCLTFGGPSNIFLNTFLVLLACHDSDAHDPKYPASSTYAAEDRSVGETVDVTRMQLPAIEAARVVPVPCDAGGVEPGLRIRIIGTRLEDSVGSLAVQFAIGRGHSAVSVNDRPEGRQVANEGAEHLRPQEIIDFADDGRLAAVLVCMDNLTLTEWSPKLLAPRVVSALLGLLEDGFKFTAFDLIFQELRV
ncbi:hypothetical protein BJY00DRAFT_19957 [Aspergillus carlsbadensis]|nr:hypothetical protein BJY00DRAFT_19957 [Aspergillus carlsbadensis]